MKESERSFAPTYATRVAGDRSETREQLVADQALYLQTSGLTGVTDPCRHPPDQPFWSPLVRLEAKPRKESAVDEFLRGRTPELVAQPSAFEKAEFRAAKSSDRRRI